MYKFWLYGPFYISDQFGKPVGRIGRKECALLAILALSPNYSRSRNWLKSILWSDRAEKQASGSLRQSIWRIRSKFGLSDLLLVDNDTVRLNPKVFTVQEAKNENTSELLEGIQIRDEAFEDWLRLERTSKNGYELSIPQNNLQNFYGIPCIVVHDPIVLGSDRTANLIATFLLDKILAHLKTTGLTELFLVSNFYQNQSNTLSTPQTQNDAILSYKATLTENDMWIDIQVNEVGTGRNLAKFGKLFSEFKYKNTDSDEFVEFISSSAIAIEAAAYNTSRLVSESQNMFKAVHQLMSHSLEGQRYARKYFQRLRHNHSNAVATAWDAFSYAVGIGERYERSTTDFLAKAMSLCQEAIEMQPTNAVVRSIVGHVNAFVFRDFQVACEQQSLARELSPESPIVWDFSSMTALYTGQPEVAYNYAKNASHLGRSSALKPYFDTSVMMCAATTGRHTEAIAVGCNVLRKIPNLLPVMRHLVGSYAATNEIDSARRMALQVAEKDIDFSDEQIGNPEYPVIAPDSIALLKNGFSAMGAKYVEQF